MNFLPILVAAAVCFVIGFLFHGPLFGSVWMRLAKITPTGKEKFSDMLGQMAWNYVANVVCAFVLSMIIWVVSASPLIGGMTWYKGGIFAAWLWLGFIVTNSSSEVVWMGRSFKLWLFEMVSSLVCMVAMGIILAVWR